MENTDIRGRVAEVAAPQGGWPQLTPELVEVRFFLQQGELDEAYEMLSILQRRFPGHPELADFARTGGHVRQADEQVEALVDGVLADSSNLAGQVLRRRSVQWAAPEAPAGPAGAKPPKSKARRKFTTAHEVVRAAIHEATPEFFEDEAPAPARSEKPPVRHHAKTKSSARKAKAKAGRARKGAKTREMSKPAPPPLPELAPTTKKRKVPLPKKKPAATRVYRAVTPRETPRPGMTVAVDALQMAAPFGHAEPPQDVAAAAAVEGARKKKAKGKRARKLATKTSRKRKLEAREKKAPRTVAFGAGVLSRYGR